MNKILFIITVLVAFQISVYAQESITVRALPIGISTKYMGVTGSYRDFDITVFKDLGINTNRIFSSVENFEPLDDNGDYGKPSINEVKANINIIPWDKWDNVINSNGLKDYLDAMKSINVKVIINLRTNSTGWMANIPKTPEDENEWWEHCAALAYWLNVRNDYQMDDYQFFNEPDQGAGQEFGNASVEDYVRLARLANDALGFVYSHYLPGRKYETYGPVTSWANSWITDMLTKAGDVFSNVDFHQYSSKNQFTDAIGAAHGMMNATGYAGLPVWMTEWGSYDFDLPNVRQNNSVPFAIKMINNVINMCAPGDGHISGWEYYNYAYGSYGDEIMDENNEPRSVYYALRLAIRGLKGGKPIYSCNVSNNKLKAIASKDDDGTINVLVTDTSSIQSHTVNINLSALSVVAGSATTLSRYDASNKDVSSVGPTVGSNGVVQITIPPSGAVLIKAQGTGSGKDSQLPSSPTALTSTAATYNSVSLKWTASTDNIGVDCYEVYINDRLLKSAKGNALNLTVDKLKPSTAYELYIKARDAAGNVAQSNTISVTTKAQPTATVNLAAPANLTASSTDTTVKLLWNLSSYPNIKGYQIFQGTELIATTSSSGYIIKGLSPDKMYTFKVSAMDSIVSVSPSSLISIGTEVSGVTKLTGTVFGFGPSTDQFWYGAAYDGDVNTFYDIYSVKPEGNGGYCGIDLGAGVIKKITKIRFILNRGSWAAPRVIGGKFQGSNISETSGYTDLNVIEKANDGIWNQIMIDNSTGYRYLRYVAPDGSYGNISEIEFYGVDTTVGVINLTGLDKTLNIYPNPVTSATAISLNTAELVEVSVSICNVVGQEVLSIHTLIQGESKIPIDLTNQKNGLYIVKIYIGENVITKKIMK